MASEETEKVPPVPAGPKFQFAFIVIPTVDVNHTALFKAAEKGGKMKKEYFSRLFYTGTPGPYGPKDRSTREHDEVITLACEQLGIKVSFTEKKTNKGRNITRYAIFYIHYRTSEPGELLAAEKELNEFIKHYRRHDRVYPVQIIPRIENIVV